MLITREEECFCLILARLELVITDALFFIFFIFFSRKAGSGFLSGVIRRVDSLSAGMCASASPQSLKSLASQPMGA